jgi:DNA-binding MarR family transcriptional regulator
MPASEKRLSEYMESISGHPLALKDAPKATQASLPLFLRERYELCRIKLFGRECLLALETPGWDAGSPAEYAAHAQAMLKQFSEPVTLVIPHVASYTRNRMVQAGTPFIVPGSQLFMPFMMVDLRERFTAPGAEAGLPLTPAAQFIMLYHLLRKPLQGMPLQEIAKLTGYTGMTVTKVKDEWETNGLCRTVRLGRSVVIEFTAGGRRLWHMAEQLLSSPVKKSEWVRWKDWERFGAPGLPAGYTALSMTTMTEDDPVPTWALPQQAYRKMLMNGIFHTVSDPEAANLRVEAWSYDPRLLSDGPCVDPLSLVLSLRGDSDDRVQQQLQTVLDEAFSGSTSHP